MLIEDAQLILGAWRERLVTDASVISWADRVIASMAAAELPEWLMDLSVRGPARCMAGPSNEFLEVPFLAFLESFAVRVSLLEVDATGQVDAFIEWISRAAMGEDLDVPEVKFGYQVEHLLGDCERLDLAREYVRTELPKLRKLRSSARALVLELQHAT
jgi:hypothetical protein